MLEYINRGHVIVTGSSEEIVEQLVSVRRAVLDGPLVVGDVNPGVAGRDIENRLLKILEGLDKPAIFLSSKDDFSEIFLSRFVQIVKEIPANENRSDSFSAFRATMIDIFKGEDVDALGDIVRDAPSFFPLYLRYLQSPIPKKYKVMDLLVGSPA
jgi:hypothetical protein